MPKLKSNANSFANCIAFINVFIVGVLQKRTAKCNHIFFGIRPRYTRFLFLLTYFYLLLMVVAQAGILYHYMNPIVTNFKINEL